MKLKLSIVLGILLAGSCSSDDRIKNTAEARLFLASHEWHDSNASFITKDGESHTAPSSVQFTDKQVTSNKQDYYYNIERREGSDIVSQRPYYLVTWFDNYLQENMKFYLYDDGGGSLESTRWKLRSFDNKGKPIVHIAETEPENGENIYEEQYDSSLEATITSIPISEDTVVEKENHATHTPLFQGTKVFCDTQNNYYYIVIIEGTYIKLSAYSGIYSKENSTDKPVSVTVGRIENNKIITKNDEGEGEEQELFEYINGNLVERAFEDTLNTYLPCE